MLAAYIHHRELGLRQGFNLHGQTNPGCWRAHDGNSTRDSVSGGVQSLIAVQLMSIARPWALAG
jgi:hypothetical protein